MSKRKMALKSGEESFGDRLARLRKAAGYTLRELGAEVGVSHRMLVYYENHAEGPPAHLLPQLCKALGVSADELLGIESQEGKRNGHASDRRLWRRFREVEKLRPAQRRPIIQLIDAFLVKAASE